MDYRHYNAPGIVQLMIDKDHIFIDEYERVGHRHSVNDVAVLNT
jgi:hypothetical protein